jgi:hypothetical protein
MKAVARLQPEYFLRNGAKKSAHADCLPAKTFIELNTMTSQENCLPNVSIKGKQSSKDYGDPAPTACLEAAAAKGADLDFSV